MSNHNYYVDEFEKLTGSRNYALELFDTPNVENAEDLSQYADEYQRLQTACFITEESND